MALKTLMELNYKEIVLLALVSLYCIYDSPSTFYISMKNKHLSLPITLLLYECLSLISFIYQSLTIIYFRLNTRLKSS